MPFPSPSTAGFPMSPPMSMGLTGPAPTSLAMPASMSAAMPPATAAGFTSGLTASAPGSAAPLPVAASVPFGVSGTPPASAMPPVPPVPPVSRPSVAMQLGHPDPFAFFDYDPIVQRHVAAATAATAAPVSTAAAPPTHGVPVTALHHPPPLSVGLGTALNAAAGSATLAAAAAPPQRTTPPPHPVIGGAVGAGRTLPTPSPFAGSAFGAGAPGDPLVAARPPAKRATKFTRPRVALCGADPNVLPALTTPLSDVAVFVVPQLAGDSHTHVLSVRCLQAAQDGSASSDGKPSGGDTPQRDTHKLVATAAVPGTKLPATGAYVRLLGLQLRHGLKYVIRLESTTRTPGKAPGVLWSTDFIADSAAPPPCVPADAVRVKVQKGERALTGLSIPGMKDGVNQAAVAGHPPVAQLAALANNAESPIAPAVPTASLRKWQDARSGVAMLAPPPASASAAAAAAAAAASLPEGVPIHRGTPAQLPAAKSSKRRAGSRRRRKRSSNVHDSVVYPLPKELSSVASLRKLLRSSTLGNRTSSTFINFWTAVKVSCNASFISVDTPVSSRPLRDLRRAYHFVRGLLEDSPHLFAKFTSDATDAPTAWTAIHKRVELMLQSLGGGSSLAVVAAAAAATPTAPPTGALMAPQTALAPVMESPSAPQGPAAPTFDHPGPRSVTPTSGLALSFDGCVFIYFFKHYFVFVVLLFDRSIAQPVSDVAPLPFSHNACVWLQKRLGSQLSWQRRVRQHRVVACQPVWPSGV